MGQSAMLSGEASHKSGWELSSTGSWPKLPAPLSTRSRRDQLSWRKRWMRTYYTTSCSNVAVWHNKYVFPYPPETVYSLRGDMQKPPRTILLCYQARLEPDT